MRKALLGVALALWLAPAAHAAAPTRILYVGDWTGNPEVFAVDPSGKAPVAQITHWHGSCAPSRPIGFVSYNLYPSPDGRYVLITCDGALWLVRADGGGLRQVAAPSRQYWGVGDGVGRPVWSRDSKRFVYQGADSVRIFDMTTGADREAEPREFQAIGWTPFDPLNFPSPDGRWLVQLLQDRLTLVRTKDRTTVASFPKALTAAWSPNGRWVGFESHDGISVFNLRTRQLRTLTRNVGFGERPREYEHELALGFAWAPDSRSIVYPTGKQMVDGSDVTIVTGNLRTVTLTGKTRTVARRARAYGGRMTAVAWMRAARGARYQRPEPAPRTRVSANSLLADGTIDMLAADGDRVAYEACNSVAVWTPSTAAVERFHQTTAPGSCSSRDRYFLYDLALSGDRVAYGLSQGCNSISLTLYMSTVGAGLGETSFEQGRTNCASPFWNGVGRLAGSGGLLVFGEWHETLPPSPPGSIYFPTTSAAVRRLDGTACPCPALASTPGPLYPADVSGDRIVVYGDNETWVLDRDGSRLLSLPVSPSAAQLSGTDLVLVFHGQLRVYDVRSGTLLHTWPLPDVASGPWCRGRTCPPHTLTVHDAARGLVAYTVDGQLHLLRLADGADSVVAQASLARFLDKGLVYADGSRLHLVPFASLPLR